MKRNQARIVVFACLVVGLLTLYATPALAQKASTQPLDAAGWFRRAGDQMNLRQPGSAPFHLKVVFHALPGVELTKKPEIVTGNGLYEETWLSHRKWRREVTLGSYHAIEVQSDRERKVQANSDYEPSRILMLMECLLNPVPRDLIDADLSKDHAFWIIKSQTAGKLSYIRISRTVGFYNSHMVAYIFLPDGMLVESNDKGLLSSWKDEVVFGGKAVPKHFSVQAEGKPLLLADVEISQPGEINPEFFDLPDGSADEGLTLAPLHRYETRHLENLDGSYGYFSHGGSPPFSFRFVVDRRGFVRELELVDGSTLGDAAIHADFIRRWRYRPADIDGSPCELAWVSYL